MVIRKPGCKQKRPTLARWLPKSSLGDRVRNGQNSRRTETCPVRLPPKSDPRTLVIFPKLPLVKLRFGSARFAWLRTFVKVPSARNLSPSVRAKTLLKPEDRLTVPGPCTSPTPEVPKRPMGFEATPTVQALPA